MKNNVIHIINLNNFLEHNRLAQYLLSYNKTMEPNMEFKIWTEKDQDIKDALLELRIAKYIRYNSETNMFEANAVPYDKWNEEEYQLYLLSMDKVRHEGLTGSFGGVQDGYAEWQ